MKGILTLGLFCSGILLLAGCRNRNTDILNTDAVTVKMDIARSGSPFIEAVSSMEVIPIETDDTHILGSNVGLCLLRDGFLLYDRRNMKVYRYSRDGRFLNEIGRRGNSPGEYLSLRNIQVIGDEIHVFSNPGTELIYSLDGNLLGQNKKVPVGFGVFLTETGLLTYYGYSSPKKHKVVFTEETTGRESDYLPLDAKLLALDLENDVFGQLPGGGVSIIDSYLPTIYQYKENEVRPYLTFDFGKYSIRQAFYETGDPFESAEMLMAANYAVIGRYMEGSRHQLVQVNLFDQKRGQGECRYGLNDGNKWVWFSTSDYGLDDYDPFCCFHGEVLYGLFTAKNYMILNEVINGKKALAETVLKECNPDNYVLAKIHLR